MIRIPSRAGHARGDAAERGRTGRDRGVADALGLVVLAPVILTFVLVVVVVSRGVDGRAQLRTAAASAAQAAALERDPVSAESAARRVLDAMLRDTDSCGGVVFDIKYPLGREPGVGTSFGLVEVTLRCTTSTRGVEIIDDRSAKERTSEVKAVAAIDFFRAEGEP